MGARKRLTAESRKEEKKQIAIAKLNNCPTSPRKMALVADMIRGMEVEKAWYLLKHSPKDASRRMEKLLKSAINNWEQKTEKTFEAGSGLVVKHVTVDSGRQLKRLRPAPQGRGYRIRKRSNHVTIILDTNNNEE
jgi:large subunit ribosomal protein L22